MDEERDPSRDAKTLRRAGGTHECTAVRTGALASSTEGQEAADLPGQGWSHLRVWSPTLTRTSALVSGTTAGPRPSVGKRAL